MKKVSILFAIIALILCFSCKKESAKKVGLETVSLTEAEIDIQKIESLTGIQCRILKTEAIGYIPIHKFYWVCLREKTSRQKIEELADAIIRETITNKPNTYNSFTIHFFCESELAETFENSTCFAQASFLPEGDWAKVGRIPIDEYKNYTLNLKFLE